MYLEDPAVHMSPPYPLRTPAIPEHRWQSRRTRLFQTLLTCKAGRRVDVRGESRRELAPDAISVMKPLRQVCTLRGYS